MKKGKLIVISGASGVGKGTVLGIMMEKRKDLSFSVSATTRPPRPGAIDGVHYYFITRVLLDIEPKGAKQVKEKAPDAVLIFIMPPSVQELERRLRGRGDTSEEQIQMRMERATWEMEQRVWYDHVVVNDDPERCAQEILKIIAE